MCAAYWRPGIPHTRMIKAFVDCLKPGTQPTRTIRMCVDYLKPKTRDTQTIREYVDCLKRETLRTLMPSLRAVCPKPRIPHIRTTQFAAYWSRETHSQRTGSGFCSRRTVT